MARIVFGILLMGISFISFGQEKPEKRIGWKKIGTYISDEHAQYRIPQIKIIPSLSYIRQIAPQNYQLMEINLDIDLRKKENRNHTPILQLPENQFIQSEYSATLSVAPKTNTRSFRVTGGVGYDSTFYNNQRSNNSNGGIKNNAYKDVSLYTGIYCPATGLPYY